MESFHSFQTQPSPLRAPRFLAQRLPLHCWGRVRPEIQRLQGRQGFQSFALLLITYYLQSGRV
jgi:hypothetical protein